MDQDHLHFNTDDLERICGLSVADLKKAAEEAISEAGKTSQMPAPALSD